MHEANLKEPMVSEVLKGDSEGSNVLVIPRLHRSNLSKLATRKLVWPTPLGVSRHLELSFVVSIWNETSLINKRGVLFMG